MSGPYQAERCDEENTWGFMSVLTMAGASEERQSYFYHECEGGEGGDGGDPD